MTALATERAVTIVPDGGSPVLEGLFLAADVDGTGAVVAAPHPQMGGSMDHPVLGEVARVCSQAGVASLRVNWRGAGGSAGRSAARALRISTNKAAPPAPEVQVKR